MEYKIRYKTHNRIFKGLFIFTAAIVICGWLVIGYVGVKVFNAFQAGGSIRGASEILWCGKPGCFDK